MITDEALVTLRRPILVCVVGPRFMKVERLLLAGDGDDHEAKAVRLTKVSTRTHTDRKALKYFDCRSDDKDIKIEDCVKLPGNAY